MRLNCPRYNDIIILTKENAAVFIIGVRNKGGAMEGKRTLGNLTRTILILLICYPLLRIGNIIAISLYILILTLIILVKPSAFGNIFYECVYNQYLKNIVCKFGFRKKY